jgi:hypothetical protein
LGEELKHRGAKGVWCFDEGRFGLKVWFRRRWCPKGERPEWTYTDNYEWLWLYIALEPSTGDCLCLYLPYVDTLCMQLFVDRLGEYVGKQRVGLVLDNSGAHKSGGVKWPEQIQPLYLPSYSPKLNPAEAVFRYLRAKLSNRVFEKLSDLEAALTDALSKLWQHPATLQSLTGYPWWLDTTHNIAPLTS